MIEKYVIPVTVVIRNKCLTLQWGTADEQNNVMNEPFSWTDRGQYYCTFFSQIFCLGASWALDLGYVGSLGSVLTSMSMYSSDIGVVGTGQNVTGTGSIFARYPGDRLVTFI
jgi:hypothetical protein